MGFDIDGRIMFANRRAMRSIGIDTVAEVESDDDDIRRDAVRIELAGNDLLALVNNVLEFSKMDAGKVEHLLGLINNFLDVSKIEAGKMTLFLEAVNLDKAVDDVAVTARPLVEKNGNAFDLQAAAPRGTARCEATKLRQIMLNLLSNAATFTERGKVTLAVARQNGALNIEVSDTGFNVSLPLEEST